MHVYCFEPSLTHFEALLKLCKSLGSALKVHQAEWHLINAAVGSGVRLVRFPRACDTELCAVAGSHQVRGAKFLCQYFAFYMMIGRSHNRI